MPLWASYLIKAYSWRLILADQGVVDWLLKPLGLSPPGYGDLAVWIVFVYLWLPYMILPIFAGLERIPNSLLEASADLGGKGWITFRKVIFPLTVPAIAAGSIFTFSLTLGDYIVPGLVSTTQFIGNVIFVNVAQNLPLAAALLIGATRDHAHLPVHRAPLRRIRRPVNSGRAARVGLRLATAFVLAVRLPPADDRRPVRVQQERHKRVAAGRVHTRMVR